MARKHVEPSSDYVRVALYVRVSSDMQAEKDLSIPAQIRELTDYAVERGWVIVATYADEAESAKTADRPEFTRMINDAKNKPRPFDVILYHKNDRFARNVYDAAMYKRLLRRDLGIDLVSMAEEFDISTPTGQFMEHIMDGVAEWYSANLGQETLKGLRQKALKGGVVCLPPIGYKIDNGKIVINEDAAPLVRWIFDQYAHEMRGLPSICSTLSMDGAKMFGEVANKIWRHQTVRSILLNRAYTGVLYFADIVVPGEAYYPRLIDQETFDRVQEIFSQRTFQVTPQDYLLKGLIKCAKCGKSMVRFTDKYTKRDGSTSSYHSYVCNTYLSSTLRPKACSRNAIKSQVIEDAVIGHMADIVAGAIRLTEDQLLPAGQQVLEKERAAREKELAKLGEKFDRQMVAYENGVITLDQLVVFKARLEEEKNAIESEIAATRDEESPINQSQLIERLSNTYEIVTDKLVPMADKRRALGRVIQYVSYDKDADSLKVVFKC